jgi:hypothetical protein
MHEASDKHADDEVRELDDKEVAELRELIRYTAPWTIWPDFQRVSPLY